MPVIPPAGLSPLGFFVEQTFRDPTDPPAILADAIDPETHDYLSIDRGQDPIDAQVILALKTVRGSGAAVTDTGNQFTSIGKLDDSAEAAFRREAEIALSLLVTNRDIRIDSIEVLVQDDFAEVTVTYENLRTIDRNRQRSQAVRIPLELIRPTV